MSFVQRNMVLTSSGLYDTESGQEWGYKSSVDNLAAVKASAYFNDMRPLPNIGDKISAVGSDGSDILRVIAVTPNITVTDYVALTASEIPLTDSEFLVGNPSNVAASVAMGGDATLTNTGVVTVGAVLDGRNSANVSASNVIGGLTLVHVVTTSGGATADTDITLTHKSRVIDAWVVNRTIGTASDTITIKNTASLVTDAMDISGAAKTIARMGTLDTSLADIPAGGILRITETDGGGSDSPQTTVYVKVIRIV